MGNGQWMLSWFKECFRKRKISWQLVPPHNHWENAAKRAIQTFKHHFKSCLVTIDPAFLLPEWNRLLPQAEITLNLLQSARVNPWLSAYVYIFGEFDFNKTPLVPPDTKVVAHTKVCNRKTWEVNQEEDWYIR